MAPFLLAWYLTLAQLRGCLCLFAALQSTHTLSETVNSVQHTVMSAWATQGNEQKYFRQALGHHS